MRIWGYYLTIIEVAMERIAGRRGECTGTSVTHWTGDIRYKSLAELRAQIEVCGWSLLLLLNTSLAVGAVGMWKP